MPECGHEPFVGTQEEHGPNRKGGGRNATTQDPFSLRLGARGCRHDAISGDGGGKGDPPPANRYKPTTTTTISLITGVGTSVSSGHLSHLGAVTGSGVAEFALVGANGFSSTGMGTTVAANGDKLYARTGGGGPSDPQFTTSVV